MVSSSTSISASGFSVEASSSLSSSADSPPFKRPQEVETMYSEWTDRKHQFYLNSLETSFINQLYRSEYGSTDLLGRPLKTDKCQTSQGPNANPISYQVRWGNLNFKRQRGWANINNGKGLHWKGSDASSKESSVAVPTAAPGSGAATKGTNGGGETPATAATAEEAGYFSRGRRRLQHWSSAVAGQGAIGQAHSGGNAWQI